MLNFSSFYRFFFSRKDPEQKIAQQLYRQIVTQSRNSVFYQDYMIDDGVQKRIELIFLHAFVYIDWLNKNQFNDISQKLFNVMFENFDINYRELGVSDMGLGKKMKKTINRFYMRSTTYSKHKEIDFDKLLLEIFYDNESTYHEQCGKLRNYFINAIKKLDQAKSTKDFLNEEIFFPAP